MPRIWVKLDSLLLKSDGLCSIMDEKKKNLSAQSANKGTKVLKLREIILKEDGQNGTERNNPIWLSKDLIPQFFSSPSNTS